MGPHEGLAEMARTEGLELIVTEGGNHSKVTIGNRQFVVARHREISEITAKAIIEQMTVPTTEGK